MGFCAMELTKSEKTSIKELSSNQMCTYNITGVLVNSKLYNRHVQFRTGVTVPICHNMYTLVPSTLLNS